MREQISIRHVRTATGVTGIPARPLSSIEDFANACMRSRSHNRRLVISAIRFSRSIELGVGVASDDSSRSALANNPHYVGARKRLDAHCSIVRPSTPGLLVP